MIDHVRETISHKRKLHAHSFDCVGPFLFTLFQLLGTFLAVEAHLVSVHDEEFPLRLDVFLLIACYSSQLVYFLLALLQTGLDRLLANHTLVDAFHVVIGQLAEGLDLLAVGVSKLVHLGEDLLLGRLYLLVRLA